MRFIDWLFARQMKKLDKQMPKIMKTMESSIPVMGKMMESAMPMMNNMMDQMEQAMSGFDSDSEPKTKDASMPTSEQTIAQWMENTEAAMTGMADPFEQTTGDTDKGRPKSKDFNRRNSCRKS